MKSIHPELALYGGKIECARTDNAFFPISEVYDGTASLRYYESKLQQNIWCPYPYQQSYEVTVLHWTTASVTFKGNLHEHILS